MYNYICNNACPCNKFLEENLYIYSSKLVCVQTLVKFVTPYVTRHRHVCGLISACRSGDIYCKLRRWRRVRTGDRRDHVWGDCARQVPLRIALRLPWLLDPCNGRVTEKEKPVWICVAEKSRIICMSIHVTLGDFYFKYYWRNHLYWVEKKTQ